MGWRTFCWDIAAQWMQGNLSTYYNREHVVGAYAQDAWKVTLAADDELWVRWEPYLPWSSKYGWFSHFDQKLFDENVRSNVFVNARSG